MARKTYKKIITTPELIAQINPINQRLVNRFLKNFDTKRSDSSVKVYKSNFNIFFCWNIIYNDNKSFIDIKKSQLLDFFDFAVSDLKWSPNRYSQMWSSLSSLSNFIENILDDEYPDFRNIVKKIDKLPKNVVREKTILTEDQINNLMKWLDQNELYQEECLLALAISSGARISELFRFDIDLIDESNVAFDGLFLETKKEIKTKGAGKQGAMKYKYIIKDIFMPIYKKWIGIRNETLKKNNINHNSLFIKKDGTPANADTARYWMKKWENYLTNDEPTNIEHKYINLYPHCLRHYIVTYLSRIGLESDFIIAVMGWKSADMYSIYNDMTAKEKDWKSLDKLKDSLKGDE